MDGKPELMRILAVSLLFSSLFTACTKCVECEVRLKQSQNVIGNVDEFCGTDKKVEEEEDRLKASYTCIECTPSSFSGVTPEGSGVLCGDRAYTDSVEAIWKGAEGQGVFVNCTYYRDTADVRCILKQ